MLYPLSYARMPSRVPEANISPNTLVTERVVPIGKDTMLEIPHRSSAPGPAFVSPSLFEEALLDLGGDFPNEVHVVRHDASGRYGCFCHEGVHGLASFTRIEDAREFSTWIKLDGLSIITLAFDEARDVAKARPMPVVSLMLLDDFNRPLIHYVR